MSDVENDSHEEIEWNPFDYVEEDRDVLEKIAAVRVEQREFPAHLLTTDPLVAREIVRRAKAEKVIENAKDYSWGEPEIPARPAEPAEWPRAAKTLAKKLDGWTTSGWYMRGPVISAQNRERTIKTAFVLKAGHRDGRRLRVIFHEKDEAGKWDRKNNWIYLPDANVTWQATESVAALESYANPSEPEPLPIPLEG